MREEDSAMARLRAQKAAVCETIAGYAQAAAVIERERMERLARMTAEEAQAIYDGLCASWQQTDDLERLEQWRLETLLAVREAIARLSGRVGIE
jgi:hypothetical protein